MKVLLMRVLATLAIPILFVLSVAFWLSGYALASNIAFFAAFVVVAWVCARAFPFSQQNSKSK